MSVDYNPVSCKVCGQNILISQVFFGQGNLYQDFKSALANLYSSITRGAHNQGVGKTGGGNKQRRG